jgi:hypothetical protein
MADYWTNFCFVIPANREQGAWLYGLHGAASRRLGDCEGDWRQQARDVETSEAAEALAARFDTDGSPGIGLRAETGALRISSEGGLGNPAYAAALVQLFLQRFELDEIVSFQWSLTCSEPRPNGNGGGAAVVSRNRIELFDTGDFVAEAMRRAAVETGSPIPVG